MKVKTFSLPSGWTCPGALECHSRAVKNKRTGRVTIVDGKHTQFRCFSASQEVQYTNVYNSRQHNLKLIKSKKSTKAMANLIEESLLGEGKLKFGSGNAKLDRAKIDRETVRIHIAGDFFKQSYLDAWIEVARRNPTKRFYAYTKSLHFWTAHLNGKRGTRKNPLSGIPGVPNLVLTASRGGKFDHLINEYKLREAIVVFTEAEAKERRLEIDHDDTHAMKPGPSFALLLHGTQAKGSEASKALQALKQIGKGGYSKK